MMNLRKLKHFLTQRGFGKHSIRSWIKAISIVALGLGLTCMMQMALADSGYQDPLAPAAKDLTTSFISSGKIILYIIEIIGAGLFYVFNRKMSELLKVAGFIVFFNIAITFI